MNKTLVLVVEDDVLKNLTFSKETQQINNRVVPCAVLLRDVTVAGE